MSCPSPAGRAAETSPPLRPNGFLFKVASDILINNRGGQRPLQRSELGVTVCWFPGATTIGVRWGLEQAGSRRSAGSSPGTMRREGGGGGKGSLRPPRCLGSAPSSLLSALLASLLINIEFGR